MIVPILTRKHFNKILEAEGWTVCINDLFMLCPFDTSIRVHTGNGTFFRGGYNSVDYEVICKISNVRTGKLEFDSINHVISNGIFMLRTQ